MRIDNGLVHIGDFPVNFGCRRVKLNLLVTLDGRHSVIPYAEVELEAEMTLGNASPETDSEIRTDFCHLKTGVNISPVLFHC